MYFYVPPTFTLRTVDIPAAASSTTYTFELDFAATAGTDLGSSLSDGNDYPYNLETSTFSSFTLTTGTPALLKGKLGNTILATATTSILYTVVYSANSAFGVTPRGYYTIDADPRNKYQTHELAATSYDLDTAVGAPITVTTTNAAASRAIGLTTAVTALGDGGLKLKLNTTNTNVTIWAISYPQGWTLSSTSTVGDGTNTVNCINLTPSSSSTTRFVFYLTTQIFTEATFTVPDDTEIVFKGAISSNYILPNTEIIFSIGSVTTTWGTACVDYFSATQITTDPYSMTGGTITVSSISPNSIKGRGPTSVNLTEVVVFTVPHLIPAGGNIVASVDSNWGVASPATCSVSGLTNRSTTLTVAATLSSTTCTVTNFAEVSANSSITLTFTGLLPPTHTSSTSDTNKTFLTSIVSNFIISSTTYQIDTSTAVVVTIAAASVTGRSSFVTKTTYPQNASTTDLDLYLKFSLASSSAPQHQGRSYREHSELQVPDR
jgi:hypothetical protein